MVITIILSVIFKLDMHMSIILAIGWVITELLAKIIFIMSILTITIKSYPKALHEDEHEMPHKIIQNTTASKIDT